MAKVRGMRDEEMADRHQLQQLHDKQRSICVPQLVQQDAAAKAVAQVRLLVIVGAWFGPGRCGQGGRQIGGLPAGAMTEEACGKGMDASKLSTRCDFSDGRCMERLQRERGAMLHRVCSALGELFAIEKTCIWLVSMQTGGVRSDWSSSTPNRASPGKALLRGRLLP